MGNTRAIFLKVHETLVRSEGDLCLWSRKVKEQNMVFSIALSIAWTMDRLV